MDRENAFHALYVITLSIVLLGAHGAPPNARLEHFPGYNWTLPSAHYAGYITVGRNNERHLYYYFATSQRNPSEDPVVLWLDGGPGCAALNVLLHQIGPFKFDTTSARVPKVQLNPYSLNKELKDACNGNYWNSSDPDCLLKMQAYKQNVAGINPFHILCLPCRYETRTEEVITSQENLLECSDPSEDMEWPSAVTMNGYFRPWPLHLYYDAHCLDYNERPRILLNDPASRKALHAQPEEITGEWLRCSNHLVYQKEFGSMIKYHMNLTKKGYRAFIYSGDHDFALPYLGTQAWIQSMGYSIIEKWRPWFVGDQIAGYSTKYDHNLTFATFKGGGHTVPEYQPQQALVAYARWLNEDPL